MNADGQNEISVPLEIVDHILLQFKRASVIAIRDPLSACSLVSHTWLDLSRRHRYSTFQYELTSPLYDDYWSNQPPKPKTLAGLLEVFDEHPVICRYIQSFNLQLSMVGYSNRYHMVSGEVGVEPHRIPFSDRHRIPIYHFLEVLRRLPSLRKLQVPLSFAGQIQSSVLSKPIVSNLDQLTVVGDEGQEDGSLHTLYNLLGFFGAVRHLVFDNIHVRDYISYPDVLDEGAETTEMTIVDDQGARSPLQRVFTHFSVQTFEITHGLSQYALHGPQPMTNVLNLLSGLPAVHLLTTLDLCYIHPKNMPALSRLIKATSPQLEDLTLELEPRSHYSFGNGAGHYSQLDLSDCGRLRILSLKLFFYWEQIQSPWQLEDFLTSHASACVIKLLELFLHEQPPPALRGLDLQVVGHALGEDKNDKVPYSQVDDTVARAVDKGRLRAVSLRSWFWDVLPQKEWDMMHLMYPRLLESGLPLRRRVRDDL